MLRALDYDRPYINPIIETVKFNFDPIRIKLRVKAMSSAPLVRAKNSDYYFIESGKNAYIGNITDAIECLKRGLMIK